MESTYVSKMVAGILHQNIEARDNVYVVVKIIHDFELSVLEKDKHDYYELFFSEQLSSFKTIDRIWRKVQEEKPELRGKNWELRQVQAGKISIEVIAQKKQLKLF